MVYSRGTLCCGNGHRRRLGRRWCLRLGIKDRAEMGIAAISFGYLQIAIGFIPMLYFVLGALSYILKWPALNEDPITKTYCSTNHSLGAGINAVWWHEIHGANC